MAYRELVLAGVAGERTHREAGLAQCREHLLMVVERQLIQLRAAALDAAGLAMRDGSPRQPLAGGILDGFRADAPAGTNYYWSVSTAGIATGQYTFYSTSYGLGPMHWSQPAITWQKPAGAC